MLREYGSERDVAAGDVLFADGDETYDLIVLLAGTADIIESYGNPDIVVLPSTQVTALTGTHHLEAVRLRREGQPEASELAVTGLFVFIGAKPGTGWLAGQLAADSTVSS